MATEMATAGSPPRRWGRVHWKIYHTANWYYDKLVHMTPLSQAEQRRQQMFLHVFVRMLPCGSCRTHGTTFHEQLDATTLSVELATTQGRCFERSVQLHNLVNGRLQQPAWALATAAQYWREPAHQATLADFWEYLLRLAVHYNANQAGDKALVYEILFGWVEPWLAMLLPPRPQYTRAALPPWSTLPTTSTAWLAWLRGWPTLRMAGLHNVSMLTWLKRLMYEMSEDNNPVGAANIQTTLINLHLG